LIREYNPKFHITENEEGWLRIGSQTSGIDMHLWQRLVNGGWIEIEAPGEAKIVKNIDELKYINENLSGFTSAEVEMVIEYFGKYNKVKTTKGYGYAESGQPTQATFQIIIEDAKGKAQAIKSLVKKVSSNNVGGIDMNSIGILKKGTPIMNEFDPAELQSIVKNGVDGFVPVIINFAPLPSVLPLLGLEPRKKTLGKDPEHAFSRVK